MSFFNVNNHNPSHWMGYEKLLFRFFFLYFVIQVVPFDWKFYRELFSINVLDFNFHYLFSLSRYSPQFFGLTGYANWGIAALLAAAGTVVWTYSKKEVQYDQLYYWLRVILRYRLAIGIIAYGLIKFFPLQMPFPSLSNLHTNYGDFYAWKIYFHTLGITPGYEIFLGATEVLAGILLFFRRTTTFGAGIIAGFTGNVYAANIAYQGGEEVYSLYLVVIALFLLAYDVPRLYNLLALKRYTVANTFQPAFTSKNARNSRLVLKSAFVFIVILLGGATYSNYTNEPYKLPKTAGLKGSYGYYNVREFKLNNKLIPYSDKDPDRWQNVIFEKWATISIKIARPVKLDTTIGDGYFENDLDRRYESAGVGGRHYYAYKADTVSRQIFLSNKNKNHVAEQFILSYRRLNDSTIVLSGVNEKSDSVYAVLDKIDKKYMLLEGRRKPVKL